ncbi:hypothetical protein FRX31_029352 [Thalictrum thalictroides]|uniref:Defensin-like protein n=1 Tax=Thalictrum thalictroides TaxID=46969 RepID=A0A7J6V8W9_THATH|nr:hypothetical protein FRX31_029352 [Thalictrum thalictroides]
MVAYKLIFFVAVLLVASGLPSMKVHVKAKMQCFNNNLACTSDFGCASNCLGCNGKCVHGQCACVPIPGPSSNPRPMDEGLVPMPCTNDSSCTSECPSGYGVCSDGQCQCQE